MGLKEWKEEFYPCSAGRTSRNEAIDHSLRKWTGLLPSNLEKHGCHAVDGCVIPEHVKEVPWKETWSFFSPNMNNCSLCHHYYDEDTNYDDSGEYLNQCRDCPIMKVTGKACDERYEYGDETSEWNRWTMENNAVPMVKLLERVKAEYENLTKE